MADLDLDRMDKPALIAALREARADALRKGMEAIQARTARQAAEADAAKMRDVIKKARDKLHAYNRPVLREGLRIEVRDMLDAALEPTP
ncbi:MAG: hypothetical protein KIT32_12195 [Rhodocyclaceae bacterium]|nr:hypothetical protein [Rhodocyclaceae bacterium]